MSLGWYIILAMAAVAVLAYLLGTECEGLRWTENADRNGTRIFFRGESFKVIKLPGEPGRMDQ